jgi:hypothetical protein
MKNTLKNNYNYTLGHALLRYPESWAMDILLLKTLVLKLNNALSVPTKEIRMSN